MEHIAAPESSSSPSNFAGLLASFAIPEGKSEARWNEDELADDIATLSYEQALRARAHYLSQNSSPAGAVQCLEPAAQPAAMETGGLRGPARSEPVRSDRSLKRASITIRLSEEESAQLHRRAAEAELTVSAYLRSCTLEVESLRAQVKETLAQLRNATSSPPKPKGSIKTAADLKPSQSRWFWPFARSC